MDTIEVGREVSDDFEVGQVTISSTPVQLTKIDRANRGVFLKVHSGEAATAYVGKDDQVGSANGYEVPNTGVMIPISDPSKLYVVTDALGTPKMTFLII